MSSEDISIMQENPYSSKRFYFTFCLLYRKSRYCGCCWDVWNTCFCMNDWTAILEAYEIRSVISGMPTLWDSLFGVRENCNGPFES